MLRFLPTVSSPDALLGLVFSFILRIISSGRHVPGTLYPLFDSKFLPDDTYKTTKQKTKREKYQKYPVNNIPMVSKSRNLEEDRHIGFAIFTRSATCGNTLSELNTLMTEKRYYAASTAL